MFIIPCAVRKSLMLRGADVFSKMMFWTENTIYLSFMLLYEIALVPIIFFRVCYNIVKLASFFNMVLLLVLWSITGILFLLFGVCKDIFFYLKILCDYKVEDDLNEEKEEEDYKQD